MTPSPPASETGFVALGGQIGLRVPQIRAFLLRLMGDRRPCDLGCARPLWTSLCSLGEALLSDMHPQMDINYASWASVVETAIQLITVRTPSWSLREVK